MTKVEILVFYLTDVLVCLVGLTHIDSVIAKDSIKASSAVGQVEGCSQGRVGGGLLGVELCVCIYKWHRLGLSLEPFP